MKICYICPNYYKGEVPFYEYTQGLARLGHEVHAVVTRREGEPRFEQVNGVSVERIAPDHSSSYDGYQFSFLQFLMKSRQAIDRQNNWDVINLRNLPGVSLLPRVYNRDQGGSWVLEIQSPPLHQGWRSTLSNYRIRFEASAFSTTLVHAQVVAEEIFGSGSGRFVELPIGVDFNHFRPGKNPSLRQDLGVSPDEILFIYTGAIMPIRQLDRLVLGFDQALQTMGNLHLLLVGDGLAVPELQELVSSLDLASHVHFLGRISYDDMPETMQAADVGLGYVPMVPWYDKAPVLKTMESMASGLPTIATATEGNRAYIEDGIDGLLVDDTPEALSQAMIKLADNNDLRLKFSRGRQAIDSFRWTRIVENILEPTYQQIVEKRQSRVLTE